MGCGRVPLGVVVRDLVVGLTQADVASGDGDESGAGDTLLDWPGRRLEYGHRAGQAADLRGVGPDEIAQLPRMDALHDHRRDLSPVELTHTAARQDCLTQAGTLRRTSSLTCVGTASAAAGAGREPGQAEAYQRSVRRTQ